MITRSDIVKEIMKLVKPTPIVMDKKPTIDELEKILNSESSDKVNILPDGTVTLTKTTTTVGEVADAILQLYEQDTKSGEENVKEK